MGSIYSISRWYSRMCTKESFHLIGHSSAYGIYSLCDVIWDHPLQNTTKEGFQRCEPRTQIHLQDQRQDFHELQKRQPGLGSNPAPRPWPWQLVLQFLKILAMALRLRHMDLCPDLTSLNSFRGASHKGRNPKQTWTSIYIRFGIQRMVFLTPHSQI